VCIRRTEHNDKFLSNFKNDFQIHPTLSKETVLLYKFLIKKTIILFGSNHPITGNLIYYLAKFYFDTNLIHKAAPLFIWANEIIENNPYDVFIYKDDLKNFLKTLYFDRGWPFLFGDSIN
jgi:hypothetical protein